MMKKQAKIFIAGHRGLVGSAVLRKLVSEGYTNLVLTTRDETDLTNDLAVKRFFRKARPEYVIDAAAKVGGILANNNYQAEFIFENLKIQTNLIHYSYLYGVKKLLFLGSTCIYPRNAGQPMKEEYLLTGELEPTNDAYAIAKIAGIKMCHAYNLQYGTNYISAMPTNLYGSNDNFDLTTSHVLPALIRKFADAKKVNADKVIVWGTGTPKREFMHVDDLADALIFLINNYDKSEIINIGVGEEISISDLAELIAGVVGYKGKIVYDLTKPDGTPRKLVDVTKLFGLGWRPRIQLKDGIEQTYKWYLENYEK